MTSKEKNYLIMYVALKQLKQNWDNLDEKVINTKSYNIVLEALQQVERE